MVNEILFGDKISPTELAELICSHPYLYSIFDEFTGIFDFKEGKHNLEYYLNLKLEHWQFPDEIQSEIKLLIDISGYDKKYMDVNKYEVDIMGINIYIIDLETDDIIEVSSHEIWRQIFYGKR